MFDLAVLERMETGLGALASRHPVPGLTRDLVGRPEAPDQVRGGVVPASDRRREFAGEIV